MEFLLLSWSVESPKSSLTRSAYTSTVNATESSVSSTELSGAEMGELEGRLVVHSDVHSNWWMGGG